MSCNCSEVHENDRVDYQYAVKIVCGVIHEKTKEHPLPIGDYKVKVNIHNPSRCDCVTFRWKVAVGFPHLKVGPISDFIDVVICPDEALEIDYMDIARRIYNDGQGGGKGNILGHTEGWVVIETPAELDVVAVYATSATADGTVNSFHTERVQPRCLPVCDDFGLDISTGVSQWEVKSGSGSYSLATLSGTTVGWAAPQPGSVWVTEAYKKDPVVYTYKLEFRLCSGFRNAVLDMHVLADDCIELISLNGHTILPNQAPAANFTTPVPCHTTQFFKAGVNILMILVRNRYREGNPTGLNVHGFIEAANGLCKGVPYPVYACPHVCYYLQTSNLHYNLFPGMVIYRDHRFEGPGCNGEAIGNTDGFHRAEQLQVQLTGAIPPGTSLQYRVFTRNLVGSLIGWNPWISSGVSGFTGVDKGITAIEVKLENAPPYCRVRYKVCTRKHMALYFPNPVWSDYYYDGATAGSTVMINGRHPAIVAVMIEIIHV